VTSVISTPTVDRRETTSSPKKPVLLKRMHDRRFLFEHLLAFLIVAPRILVSLPMLIAIVSVPSSTVSDQARTAESGGL